MAGCAVFDGPLVQRMGVSAVIRFNEKCYDRKKFTEVRAIQTSAPCFVTFFCTLLHPHDS